MEEDEEPDEPEDDTEIKSNLDEDNESEYEKTEKSENGDEKLADPDNILEVEDEAEDLESISSSRSQAQGLEVRRTYLLSSQTCNPTGHHE